MSLGRKVFAAVVLGLFVVATLLSFIPLASATTYDFVFHGVFDDTVTTDYMTFLDDSPALANVTIHSGTSSEGYVTSGTNYTYSDTTSYVAQYASYDIIDNTTGTEYTEHREYWFNTGETSGIFFVYGSQNSATYTISFLDYVGMLKSYPFVEAQVYYQTGVYLTVEKRPVDAQNIVTFDLEEGMRYRIVLCDGVSEDNNIVYGFLTPTATTGIQLVIRGVDFPKETLLKYQYIHGYALRDFLNPTGAITVSFEDENLMTNNVTVTITNASDSTVSLNQVFVSQNFSYTWNYADNATDYEVTITVDHLTYGSFYFKQYLMGEYTPATDALSLDFLGTSGIPIGTAALLPALLIIFVAGCFSETNAEVAAILTVIVAIVLMVLGWVPMDQGAIVSALAISLLAAIVTVRRRMG